MLCSNIKGYFIIRKDTSQKAVPHEKIENSGGTKLQQEIGAITVSAASAL